MIVAFVVGLFLLMGHTAEMCALSCPALCAPMGYSLLGSCLWNFPGNWSVLSLPPPGYRPDPGIELGSPALPAQSLLLSHQRSSKQYGNASNADYNVFSNFGTQVSQYLLDTLYQLVFCINCVITFSKSYMLKVNFKINIKLGSRQSHLFIEGNFTCSELHISKCPV